MRAKGLLLIICITALSYPNADIMQSLEAMLLDSACGEIRETNQILSLENLIKAKNCRLLGVDDPFGYSILSIVESGLPVLVAGSWKEFKTANVGGTTIGAFTGKTLWCWDLILDARTENHEHRQLGMQLSFCFGHLNPRTVYSQENFLQTSTAPQNRHTCSANGEMPDNGHTMRDTIILVAGGKKQIGIQKVYVVAAQDEKIEVLTRRIGEAMDRLKLSTQYKMPALNEID